jgi:hypothetical protein
VKLKKGGPWLPCSELAGDNRAASLVRAWQSGFLADVYKGQMDRGVAATVFANDEAFAKGVIANSKLFSKLTPDQLSFGYTVEFDELKDKLKDQEVIVLNKDMQKSWVDNAKDKFASFFNKDDDKDDE